MYRTVHTIGKSQPGGAKRGLGAAAYKGIKSLIKNAASAPTANGTAMQIIKVLILIFIDNTTLKR